MFEPQRLSHNAFVRIADRGEEVFLSAVSAYEVEYKRLRGQMPKLAVDFTELALPFDFIWLPVEPEDAIEAARLDSGHRDPWDRILAAQARRRNLELVTADAAIHAAKDEWAVRLVW